MKGQSPDGRPPLWGWAGCADGLSRPRLKVFLIRPTILPEAADQDPGVPPPRASSGPDWGVRGPVCLSLQSPLGVKWSPWLKLLDQQGVLGELNFSQLHHPGMGPEFLSPRVTVRIKEAVDIKSLVHSPARSRRSARASLFPSFLQTLNTVCFLQVLPKKMGRELYHRWYPEEVAWDRKGTCGQDSGSGSSATY